MAHLRVYKAILGAIRRCLAIAHLERPRLVKVREADSVARGKELHCSLVRYTRLRTAEPLLLYSRLELGFLDFISLDQILSTLIARVPLSGLPRFIEADVGHGLLELAVEIQLSRMLDIDRHFDVVEEASLATAEVARLDSAYLTAKVVAERATTLAESARRPFLIVAEVCILVAHDGIVVVVMVRS